MVLHKNKTCLPGLVYHAKVISSISDTSKCKSNIRNFLPDWPLTDLDGNESETWIFLQIYR